MFYRSDPIFTHFTQTTRQRLFVTPEIVSGSLNNGSTIEVAWGDGFEIEKLQALKNRKIDL
jgi:hypothetical protein